MKIKMLLPTLTLFMGLGPFAYADQQYKNCIARCKHRFQATKDLRNCITECTFDAARYMDIKHDESATEKEDEDESPKKALDPDQKDEVRDI